MNTKLLLLAALFCFLQIADGFPPSQNLWDQVVRQEQIIQTVIYKGRSLNVWKQDVNHYTRYYVTPLCNIDLNTLSCDPDDYSSSTPRWVFSFNVKLWDLHVATIVQQALKQKNIDAHAGDIIMLPMQFVRIYLGNPNPNMDVADEWRSFAMESLVMSFRIYPKDEAFCHKMINDATTKTDFFLNTIKLMFEFTMVASTTSSRHITIKSNFSQKSSFIANLNNNNINKNGTIFLTSNDTNNLAHEVFNSALYDEEVSSDYKESRQEDAVIKELLKSFETDKIQSVELSKEEWDSVFWDNIYTRPDIQTSFLNDTMKIDAGKKKFTFNKEKADEFIHNMQSQHSDGHKIGFSIGAMVEAIGLNLGFTHASQHSDANINQNEQRSIDNLDIEDLNTRLKQSHSNVEWTGKKFQQKNLNLYRVNTKNLQSVSETAFNRVIVSKEQSGQQIEIKAETSVTEFDHIYDTTTTTTTPPSTTTTTSITTTITATTTTTQHNAAIIVTNPRRVNCNTNANSIGANVGYNIGNTGGNYNQNRNAPCQAPRVGHGVYDGMRPPPAPMHYPVYPAYQPQQGGYGTNVGRGAGMQYRYPVNPPRYGYGPNYYG